MESSRKLSDIKDLHDKIRQSAEEAKKKESVHKQLVGKNIFPYTLKINNLFLCTYSVICLPALPRVVHSFPHATDTDHRVWDIA